MIERHTAMPSRRRQSAADRHPLMLPPGLVRDGRRRVSQVAGYSLLEVILATAVLAGSGLVVQTLIGMGSRWANQAEERSQALMLAQSLLDDVLAEGLPEGNQAPEVFDGFPQYTYQIEIEPAPTPIPNLVQLRVTIRPTDAPPNRLSPTDEALPLCELVRWVRRSGQDSTDDRPGEAGIDSGGAASGPDGANALPGSAQRPDTRRSPPADRFRSGP